MDFVRTVTNRNTECVIYRNYKYSRKRSLADGKISWVCTNKNCNGQIKTNSAVSEITEQTGHNHNEMSDRKVQSVTVRGNCKRKATEDISSRPSKIIRQELVSIENVTGMNNTQSMVSNDLVNIRLAMYRERRKCLPTIPKNIGEVFQQLKDSSLVTSRKEKFCFIHEDTNIVFFTCESNLKYLCGNSSLVLADGTFYTAPKHFSQLYTIHTWNAKTDTYVQCVFCCLPSKSKSCYNAMWSGIQKLCRNQFKPITILVDFEDSAHSSIREMFPDCLLKCCAFHLGQSWYRKIVSIGLQNDYIENTPLGKSLKSFFGLPYLPEDEVEDAFVELLSITSSEVTPFSDYVLENYITPDSRFPPSLWTHPPTLRDPATTNGAEAFHRHFKQHFTTPHPNVHILSHILTEHQAETYIKMQTTIPRRKRLKVVKKMETVDHLWSSYTAGKISQMDYIKKLGYMKQAKPL
jgi:hypothetical protein